MVEFAFTVPIVVLLFIVVVVFSFLLYSWVTLSSASREGARYIVGNPLVTDETVEAYILQGVGILNRDSIEIYISPGPEERQPGTNVTVRLRYGFQIIDVYVPYIFASGGFRMFPPIWMNAVSTMHMD